MDQKWQFPKRFAALNTLLGFKILSRTVVRLFVFFNAIGLFEVKDRFPLFSIDVLIRKLFSKLPSSSTVRTMREATSKASVGP